MDIYPFQNKVTELYGYCDISGKIIIPSQFRYAAKFEEKTALINVGGEVYETINNHESGADVKNTPSKEIHVKGGLWGIIDNNGKVIVEPKYNFIDFDYQKLRRAWIGYSCEVILFIDNYPINDKYEIEVNDDILNHGRYGWVYIKLDGTNIPIEFDWAENFKDNRGTVSFKKKWGMINSKGEFVIQPKYDSPVYFGENNFAFIKENGKMGVIDTLGNSIIEAKYNLVLKTGDFFLINFGTDDYCTGKWGLCNFLKKIIIPIEYDYIDSLNPSLFRVVKNNKWGIVDTTGKIVLEPKFIQVYDFTGNNIMNNINGNSDDDFSWIPIENGFVRVNIDKKFTGRLKKHITICKLYGRDLTIYIDNQTFNSSLNNENNNEFMIQNVVLDSVQGFLKGIFSGNLNSLSLSWHGDSLNYKINQVVAIDYEKAKRSCYYDYYDYHLKRYPTIFPKINFRNLKYQEKYESLFAEFVETQAYYSEEFISDHLISVESVSETTVGGNRSWTTYTCYEGFNVFFDKGACTIIELGDLFKEDIDYLSIINSFIGKDILSSFEEHYEHSEFYQFTVNKSEIIIYVGTHAEGHDWGDKYCDFPLIKFCIRIPYSKLRKVLNPDGPLKYILKDIQ